MTEQRARLGINELITAAIGYAHDTLQLDAAVEIHAPAVSCSFPECVRTATWVALGHNPCSKPVFACNLHKSKTDADLGPVVPGWVCTKCNVFAPETLAEATNWKPLTPPVVSS